MSDDNLLKVVYFAVCLLFMLWWLLSDYQKVGKQLVMHGVTWLGIFAGIFMVVVWVGEDEVGQDSPLKVKLESALFPNRAVPFERDGQRVLRLHKGVDGHFTLSARLNGQEVVFLIDTGATDIVLSPSDAEKIGANLSRVDFSRRVNTANGVGYVAPYRVRTLEVGEVLLSDVRVVINSTPMTNSLLGMAFLQRLRSFSFSGNTLEMAF